MRAAVRCFARGLVALCALGTALLPSPPASAQPAAPSAQPAAPSAAPVIVMPKPLTPLTAAYPEGGEGDAVVLVKLVVEKDGTVSDVSVVDGKEPFSKSALSWARTFRFAPATRDGAPIKAAIRVEVKFIAPVPIPDTGAPAGTAPTKTNGTSGAPPGAPPPSSGPAGDSQSSNSQSPDKASPNKQSPNKQSPDKQSPDKTPPDKQSPDKTPPGAPAAEEPIDVNVRGVVAPPGATTMSRAEVRLLPGAFGDPFRAVEALPGVTPIASGLPYFFVRGAPPGNVGYFLDGMRVPLLYHLGLGPSVVHPAIVDRVDLYSGGYPAQFGRFAGAVVSGETRAPRPDINGEAQIRLVDAGAMLEVPFDGGRGSALAGGRYSYTGLLFTIVQSDIRLDYWDYQARLSYDVTPRDTVTLFAFGARDFLGDKDNGKERTLVDTTFHRVDLRYDRKLGPGSTLRQAFTFGYDLTGFEGGGAKDVMLATRAELRYVATPTVTFRAGADASVDAIDTTLSRSEIGSQIPGDFATLDEHRHDFAGGAYADAIVKLGSRFEVTPGLRVDLYGSTGPAGGAAIGIDPRLSATLTLTPWLRLVQAHGFATQRPSFFLPGPGFAPSLRGGLQTTFQTSAGVEIDLPEAMEAKLVLFRSAFFNMTDALGTSSFSGIASPDDYSQRSLGSATGMELSLRRRMTKRLGGFLSYTLSDSRRSFEQYAFPAGSNRTHVLSTALGWDIGRGFRAGARIVFYTGNPVLVGSSGTRRVSTGEELPPFFRLDLRAEKKWSLGKARWISLVLEMLNTTLSKETLHMSCEGGTCEPVVIGPVSIPSIGLEGGI